MTIYCRCRTCGDVLEGIVLGPRNPARKLCETCEAEQESAQNKKDKSA